MKVFTALLLGGIAATAVTGCSRLGSPLETLTGEIPAPDEFRVVTRKPLNMPGSPNLPEPRLGERSPLEHDPGGDARALLTGNRSGSAATAGAGEEALVSAATARASSSVAGASLAEREARIDKNKPYEAPTLLELINNDGRKAEDVLDPNIEARRLRTGVTGTTPVNPKDVITSDDPDAPVYNSPGEKYEPKFPYGNQKKGS